MWQKIVKYGTLSEEILRILMLGISYFCMIVFPLVVLFKMFIGEISMSFYFMALSIFFGLINIVLNIPQNKGRY